MKRNLIFTLSFIFSFTTVSAQVPVRYEPRHKVALENDYVRLMDVRIQPGDTSLFHIHETPSFFIPLSTTLIGSQMKGQGLKESSLSADSTWFNAFESGPLIHRVWNSDTKVLHVIDLELLSPKNSTLPATKELSFLKVDFDNEKLRVYKLAVAPGQDIPLPLLQTPMLFISVAGPPLSIQDPDNRNSTYLVKAGGFQWLGSQKKYQISNGERSAVNGILILMK